MKLFIELDSTVFEPPFENLTSKSDDLFILSCICDFNSGCLLSNFLNSNSLCKFLIFFNFKSFSNISFNGAFFSVTLLSCMSIPKFILLPKILKGIVAEPSSIEIKSPSSFT